MGNPQPEAGAPLIEWAIYYARMGWQILPLHYPLDNGSCSQSCKSIGKHPLISNGVNGATKSLASIESWWQRWPQANIGIATGSSSGFLVIDVDAQHGGLDSLQQWEARYGEFQTLRVQSGGGGQHLYFIYPARGSIKNRVNLVPGIDVRSNGGYIVAPPSRHASGRVYQWKNFQPLAVAPSWLLANLSEQMFENNQSSTPAIFEGSRNAFLTSIGGSLRKYRLDYTKIKAELEQINKRLCHPPLLPTEVEAVSKSLATYIPSTPWDPIQDLKDEAVEIPNMDPSYLPAKLRSWGADIAERMQVPIDFIAAPAIVSLSALIGRKIGIYPKEYDDWFVVPNLWGAVIARPGFFKSPTIAEAMKPLEKIIGEANREFLTVDIFNYK